MKSDDVKISELSEYFISIKNNGLHHSVILCDFMLHPVHNIIMIMYGSKFVARFADGIITMFDCEFSGFDIVKSAAKKANIKIICEDDRG